MNINDGARVPTLIKIEGKLALSEYINLQYPTKMKIYIPGTVVDFNKFLINKNQIGCTYLCKFNQSLSTAVT